MSKLDKIVDVVKGEYIIAVLAVLGIFAFISAILIAYPALAYIASKLM